MSISQIVAVGIIGAVLSITVKNVKPELAVFVGLAAGIMIFMGVIGRLSDVVQLLTELTKSAAISNAYIQVILKIIGIAYIAEFGMQLCKDANEAVIASKIELAGKVLIMTVSVPIILGVLDMVTELLP